MNTLSETRHVSVLRDILGGIPADELHADQRRALDAGIEALAEQPAGAVGYWADLDPKLVQFVGQGSGLVRSLYNDSREDIQLSETGNWIQTAIEMLKKQATPPAASVDISRYEVFKAWWFDYWTKANYEDDVSKAETQEELDHAIDKLIDSAGGAKVNEPFGNSEQLRQAAAGFLAASFYPDGDGYTDDMRQTYSYWHKRLLAELRPACAMEYTQAEAEASAPQPDGGGGAVACVVNGYLPRQRAVEVKLDFDVPEWITKNPGVRAYLSSTRPSAAAAVGSCEDPRLKEAGYFVCGSNADREWHFRRPNGTWRDRFTTEDAAVNAALDEIFAAAPAAPKGGVDEAEAAYLQSLGDDPALDGWYPEPLPNRKQADPPPANACATFLRDFIAEYEEHEEDEWSAAWQGLADRARTLATPRAEQGGQEVGS